MSAFPETRTSLLMRVQSLHDEEAWHQFVTIYRPVLYRLARAGGLQHADAEDVSQRVVIAVRRAIGSWEADPAKGQFRSWLATIVRNAISNALTRRPPDAAVGGSSILRLLEGQPEPDPQTQVLLNHECRRSLFRWAARRIRVEFRDETWEAFWLTAVEGIGVGEVAAKLGKSVGAVYTARSRVMRRLKEEIEQSGFLDSDGGCNGEE